VATRCMNRLTSSSGLSRVKPSSSSMIPKNILSTQGVR
jgi:hypothetical protein